MSDTLSRAKKLFELGAHLGHRKNRLHPRARAYVYQIVNGVSIIDLEKTIAQIDKAKAFLKQASADGKTLLVCSTKKSISPLVAKHAQEVNAYYISAKWLPGLYTNFDTIAKNVKKLKDLKDQKATGEWGKFVKHEQMALDKEMRKLERLYGGIATMRKVPDITLVVDTKKEKNAITESTRMHVPTVAIVDTNCNPDEVTYPIVINDDTPAAVDAVLSELLSVYKYEEETPAPPAPSPAPQATHEPVEMKKEMKKVVKTEEVKEVTKPVSPAKKALVKKAAVKAAKKTSAKKPSTKTKK